MATGFMSLLSAQVWGERKTINVELSLGNERNPLCLTWITTPGMLEDVSFFQENPLVNISLWHIVDKMLSKESDLVISAALSLNSGFSTFGSGFKEIRDPIIPIRISKC